MLTRGRPPKILSDVPVEKPRADWRDDRTGFRIRNPRNGSRAECRRVDVPCPDGTTTSASRDHNRWELRRIGKKEE